jgi:NUMOD3 motif
MTEYHQCYVYILLDPRDCYVPFYVGRGRGKRAWMHLNTEKRIINRFKTRVIECIRAVSMEPAVLIWQDNLCLAEAKEIETELIMRWGRRGIEKDGILTNCIVSGTGGEGHRPDTRERFSQTRRGVSRGPVSAATRAKMQNNAKNRPAHLVAAQIERMLAYAAARIGKPLSKEHREKLSRPQSEETKMKKSVKMTGRKTSSGMLGRKHSEETLAKMRNKKVSNEIREKIRQSLIGIPLSEERKGKISATLKMRNGAGK